MKHSSPARRVLQDLNAELAAAAKHTGRSLVWTAADKQILQLIADTVDRRVDLLADYAQAPAESTARLKLSTELRLLGLERSLAQLLRQVKTDIPQPETQTTVKARHAARVRWDRERSPNAAG